MDYFNHAEAQKRPRSEDDGDDATSPSKRSTKDTSLHHVLPVIGALLNSASPPSGPPSEPRATPEQSPLPGEQASAAISDMHIAPHVCYGMLPDIETLLKWPVKETGQSSTDQQSLAKFTPLQLDLKPDHALVSTTGGSAVGVLSNTVFESLSACLAHTPECFLTTWVLTSEWVSKIAAVVDRKSRKGVFINVDLLFFGPRGSGGRLASDLGNRMSFLQRPHEGLYAGIYENPQSLQLPSSINFRATRTAMESQAELHSALFQTGEDEALELDVTDGGSAALNDLVQNIDNFFDHLPRHKPLSVIQKIQKDGRVMAELYRHQQEAMEWILQRELDISPDGGDDLWERSTLPSGEICYQHRITGAKSRVPSDFKGGILADDMGLGKTLTTLAAVAKSTPQGSGKATLVVVPSELLLNTWIKEIERHFRPYSIRYSKYHGSDRRDLDTILHQQDLVLTTYGTVMADRRRASSAIHTMKWHRLILDEAHLIRNWGTKQFDAVHSISSQIRWCLTGTPIQNSLDDLGSLVKFLRMPLFSEPATFRKYLTKLTRSRAHPEGEFTSLRLILSSICLRRSKDIMPQSQGHVDEYRKPKFTAIELGQYNTLTTACKNAIAISAKRSAGAAAANSEHTIMEALLRLRIFCNNGEAAYRLNLSSILTRGGRGSSRSPPDEVLSYLQQKGEASCFLCTVDIVSLGPGVSDGGNSGSGSGSGSESSSGTPESDPNLACLTHCLHLLCHGCTQEYRGSQAEGQPFTCPLCHHIHGSGSVFDEPAQQDSKGTGHPGLQEFPSKINALVEDIRAHSLTEKCVVFSFWKTTLDVAGKALDARGIKYLRVDGDVLPKKRGNILLKFQTRHASSVLLITFSTGAVGLNGLTVANRVHILEPQWNPAAEKQAIGRLLRLDQSKKVTIVRYAMEGSIEEAVQSKQLRKLQLAGGGFAKQLSPDERRALKDDQMAELQRCLGGGE
ncbi:hypothetical protein RB595_000460 [Gaeumannomyces hyphopodioides]